MFHDCIHFYFFLVDREDWECIPRSLQEAFAIPLSVASPFSLFLWQPQYLQPKSVLSFPNFEGPSKASCCICTVLTISCVEHLGLCNILKAGYCIFTTSVHPITVFPISVDRFLNGFICIQKIICLNESNTEMYLKLSRK